MCRVRILQTALCALVLQGLNLPPAMAIQRAEADPEQVIVIVDPEDVERPPVEDDDGGYLIAGHLGAQPGCPGVQGFVKKYFAGGTLAWAKTASAEKDCDGDGAPDGGGDPLFEDMTSLDPAYIQSSTMYESVFAPDGTSYTPGQVLLAWNAHETGELTVAWAAVVLHHSLTGEHLADAYFGPEILGPPATATGCDGLCLAMGNTDLFQAGGRAVAWLEGGADIEEGLVVTGWVRPEGDHDEDRNLFLGLLSPDLTVTRWYQDIPFPGPDVPMDIAMGDHRDIYITGHYGSDHDVFAGRFHYKTGALTHIFRGGGPHDDWGETIEVVNGSDLEVRGMFTDTATFESQILTGSGPTPFTALLTENLELLQIEIPGGGQSGQSASAAQPPADPGTLALTLKGVIGIPPSPPRTVHKNVPTDIDLIVGTSGTGTSPTLVVSKDEKYLILYGEEGPGYKRVVVRFEVPIAQEAPSLKSVRLRFKSEYCTNVSIFLGGGGEDPGIFHGIGGTAICPYDESWITVQVPRGIAEDELGYTPTSPPNAPLLVEIDMEVHGAISCPQGSCLGGGGADEELNAIEVGSEEEY